MRNNKKQIGRQGEDIASKFLENNGIRIIEKNYFTKYGEIDLIGIDNKSIIFVEVKLRNNYNYGLPSESIDSFKLNRLKKAIDYYVYEKNITGHDYRLDLIFISLVNGLYQIEWLKNQIF